MELYGEYDVVVIGGGASGVPAAISAARTGAKTLLVEKMGIVGGMMNVSGPPGWAFSHLWNDRGEQIIAGFVEETHHRLEKEGHAFPYPKPEDRTFMESFAFVDPDWWGLLAFEMLRENKVELLLHSLAVEPVMEGNQVRGVIVENTSGRQMILGKVIIEATGEGDINIRAGVPFTKIDRTKEEIDPPSITFHMDGVDWAKVTAYLKQNPDELTSPNMDEARKKKVVERFMKCDDILDLVRAGVMGSVTFHKCSRAAVANGDLPPLGVDLGFFFTPREGGTVQAIFQHSAQVNDCDHTNIREASAGESECRRQVALAIKAARKYMPGFENAYFTRLTSYMRVREGRHFIGDYQLTFDDVANAAKFPDVIAKCAMPVQKGEPFHSARYPAESMNIKPNRVRAAPKDGGSFDVPYRCLVPKNVEGMLMSGKLVSVSEDFKRDLLPDNIVNGQAAGVAAAICAKQGITPRQLEANVSELQSCLQQQGAILFGTH